MMSQAVILINCMSPLASLCLRSVFWSVVVKFDRDSMCFYVVLLIMAALNDVMDFFLGDHLKVLCQKPFVRLSTGKEIVTLSFSHEVKDASQGTKL
jgi:hypothetical protein